MRHFDTANAYNNEAELGAALREGDTGENVFLATKIAVTAGASARDAVAAAADRLKRAPDCVYVHSPLAPKEKRLETWAALNEARREGLCRAVGAANCGLRHLKEFEIAGPAPALVQLELSPYNQRPAEVAWARGNRAVVTCAAWSSSRAPTTGGATRPTGRSQCNMQGARRDEGPDFGPVGFAEGLRAPAPERRVGRGAAPRHRPKLVGGRRGASSSPRRRCGP